jgi:hypothetical protein
LWQTQKRNEIDKLNNHPPQRILSKKRKEFWHQDICSGQDQYQAIQADNKKKDCGQFQEVTEKIFPVLFRLSGPEIYL